MFNYVYKITDKKKGMYYIGMRSCKRPPQDDLGIHYFSSSNNKQFIKDQKENTSDYQYDVLKTFDKRKQAHQYEKELLKEAIDDIKSYNGGIHYIPRIPPLAHASKHIIKYFGNLIKIARKERKMPTQELADRMNVSRGKVQRIEKGDPKVSIGGYIEAAVILGIPIFGSDKNNINQMSSLLCKINEFLPDSMRGKTIEVDDDF